MKKLLTLSMLLLCATLAMAQFVHAATAENSNCDTVKFEQHLKTATEKAESSQNAGKKMAQENCCESCHLQLVSFPVTAVEQAAPQGEIIAAIPASPYGIFSDTLSEPPQT